MCSSMATLKPLESPEKRRKTLIVKSSFLVLVGLLTLFMHIYLKNRPISPPALKEGKPVANSSPSVLGVKSQEDLVTKLQNGVKDIRSMIDPYIDQAQTKGTEVINNTTEAVEDEAFDVAFDRAVVPVITKINNLPKDQQTQIKQAICK